MLTGLMMAANTPETQFGTWDDTNAATRAIGGGTSEAWGGFMFTAPISGPLTQLEIEAVTVTAGFDITAGLYANNSGSPGSQVGSDSAAVTISGTGTITIGLQGKSMSVTGGTAYWLVFGEDSGGSGYVAFRSVNNNASYGSGRHDTITSIDNGNLNTSPGVPGEDWRARVTIS